VVGAQDSPDGVMSSRIVGASTSVIFPLHHKTRKIALVGECFFSYQLTWLVSDKGPLNDGCCCVVVVMPWHFVVSFVSM